jgi:hypothetical protein
LRKFDPEQIDACAASALRARAREALANEFGEVGFPIVKDPRMCRLMPFWSQVFGEAEWSVRALLPLRSPLEVGWSLNRRDGLGPSYGCLLWLRYVLDAEVETRGMARAILHWPQFLGDRRGALALANEQLDLNWPRWSESSLADIDAFVSAGLRHQRASEDDVEAHPAINDLARETYASMLELVEDPEDVRVLKRLDSLRASFESAAGIFGHAVHELEKHISATETTMARIADRYADRNRHSERSGFRRGWTSRPQPTPSFVNRKDVEAIRNSVYFDGAHYLEVNPDVRAAGMDPALHYLLHGGREGRDPGQFFSTGAYLARYPDVAEAGVNALVHYETQGRKEKRRTLRDPLADCSLAPTMLAPEFGR